MPLKRPPLDSILSMLFRLAGDNGVPLPSAGTNVDIEDAAEGIRHFTLKVSRHLEVLRVSDYGSTLDTVLLGTDLCRYDVTLDGKPFAYYILRPGVSDPVEYGAALVNEIATYRHRHAGEIRLCLCHPIASALWWPDANRVIVLSSVMRPEWAGREMHGGEFHAWITASALCDAIYATLMVDGERAAMKLMYSVIASWIGEGRIEAVRSVLGSMPVTHRTPDGMGKTHEDVTLAIGLLTITLPARARLGSARVGYYRRVEAQLRAECPAEADATLRGLL